MEIKYITEFVTLVETGKFSDAADKLYLSQSSLSKHIKVLEEELGVPLLERETKRRVVLTEYGKLYLPYAEQISILNQEYMDLQKKYQMDISETLRIGSIPSMRQYEITDLLAEFQAQNPTVVLHIEEMDSSISKDLLTTGKLDFAFVRENDVQKDQSGIARIPYCSDHLCAVLPSGHRFADRENVSLSELKNEKFLLLKDSSFMYEMCLEHCFQAGFEPHVIYTGSRADNILAMVAQNSGVALLTKKPISDINNPRIRIVNIDPPIETKINLIYSTHNQLSSEASKFVQFFREITQPA